MAKANITTKNGTKVVIEGTPKEVAETVALLQGESIGSQPIIKTKTSRASTSNGAKTTPTNLIIELIDGGFFKKPKELGAIKTALEEHGHYYPVTTLSPTMVRFVRKRQLRRIRDNKRWLYVG
jgi:hypothetical protein